MIRCLMLVFCLGCVAQGPRNEVHIPVGDYAVRMCGPRPMGPGISTYSDGRGHTTISDTGMKDITDALTAFEAWSFCVEELP